MSRTFHSRTFGNNTGGTATCPALDVPVLSMADAADGTGGVATISGATAGTTNTLWAWPYPTAAGSLARTTVGSRSGNGTIAIGVPGDLALGAWLWMVESRQDESVEVSNLVAQPLTDAGANGVTDALYNRILEACATVILALGLPESPGVRAQRLATRFTGDALPFVYVVGTSEETDDESSEGDIQIAYPVLVVMMRAGNKALAEEKAVVLKWRERVRQALHKATLTGVPEVFDSRVEFNPVFDRSAWEAAGTDLSAIRVTFLANELREG